MARSIRIGAFTLAYGGGFALHTATSGAVPMLSEMRVVVEEGGRLVALGASRTNIAYLTGVPQAALEAEILDAAPRLDWSLPWDRFVAALPALSAPARMLFEMAAADGAAREAELPLAVWLGGTQATSTPTNQTLFWSDDATLLARAEAYVARGFCELKLRIAVTDFSDDLRRLALLRDRFGDRVTLSADANGRWSAAEAPARLAALAPLAVDYLEQPLPAADWAASARLADESPIRLMFDEGLGSMSAVARLAKTRAVPLGHLKLAKLGGLDRLMAAGRQLREAGIGVMVGQMNEGAVSTLAIAHAAVALDAPLRELYGADGLVNDPAGALRYQDGALHLPPGPGIGLAAHPMPADSILWEHSA